MGLTALHLAALMQNDKVDSALGATARTSAPGLRWPHLRRDCVGHICVSISTSTSTSMSISISNLYRNLHLRP